MENYKTFIYSKLKSYKCGDKNDEWKILPIYNENELIGFLKPVTFFYKTMHPEYIKLICKWRTENPMGFSNKFKNNIIKTENWFDNVLLPREDRILFVIHSLNDKPLGHIGLSTFNFDEMSCEIDNVVRGVKNIDKGIMSHATRTIINWGKETLKIKDVCLRVLSDNPHAVKFYEKNNFVKLYNIPLYKRQTSDLTEWVHLENPEGKTPERYYTYMKLN